MPRKYTRCDSDLVLFILFSARYHKAGVLDFPQASERGKFLDTKQLPEKGVLVTSLHYIPQLWCLAVGYNFGCFQLWSLYTGVLLYSSPYELEGNVDLITLYYTFWI